MHSDVFTSTVATLAIAAALAVSAPAFAANDFSTPAAQAQQAAGQNSNATQPLTKQHVDGGDLLPDTKFTTQYERQPKPAYR